MAVTINQAFDRVLAINLARRPERWASVCRQAEKHGVAIERFEAIDGAWPDVAAAWQAYVSQPLASLPEGMRPVRNSYEFYVDYDDQRARVAHVEAKHGKRAIQTPGAWAYLRSMIAILEDAVTRGLDSLLVLDDDALFHRDAAALFARAWDQLPRDWLILQLGALQYRWDDRWVAWHSENLYRCGGTSIGSHAVGMRREAFSILLAHAQRFDLPYDIGALSSLKRDARDRCFTVFPNIVVQGPMGSDISTSQYQTEETRNPDNRYRWRLEDYGIAPGEG